MHHMARKGSCFSDLNISVEGDKKCIGRILERLAEYGYERVALNEDICLVKKANLRAARELSQVVDEIPVSSRRRKLNVLRRLTVTVEDPSLLHVLGSPAAESYDLLAIRAGSEKAFQHACSTLNVDIISLDLSQRLPFYMKFPQVSQAIERGMHFEICYSPAIRDVTARRNVIANAQELVKMTKGKNIILSSEARSDFELRPPEDVSNLCHLFGFKNDQCKGTLSTACRSVLMHAAMRRETVKGVVGCVRIDSLLSPDQWQSTCVEISKSSEQQVEKTAAKRSASEASECKSKKRKMN